MNHDTGPEGTEGARTAARRHLRLVVSETSAATDVRPQPQPTLRLELRSWLQIEAPEMRVAAWNELLQCMWPGEELHIVHRVTCSDGQPNAYAMHVDVCQTLAARASQTPRIAAEAMRSALPRQIFESVTCPQQTDRLPVRAALTPLPASLATPGRTPGRSDPPAIETSSLAFPARLPNWPLTVPFDEPLARSLEIRIVVRAAEIDPRALSKLSQTLARLRSGNLHVLHPDAAPSPDGIDAKLDDAMAQLVRTWLAQPGPGFTIQVLVGSDADLSAFVLRRIGGDIFGTLPYRIHLADSDDVEPAPPVALLRPAQGIFGLFPPVSLLARMGVPRHVPAPDRLPQGPGGMVGYVGSTTAVQLPDAQRLLHTLIAGGSGTGKSSLMLRMLSQDMRRGLGVGLIDVHGDLFDEALRLIPRHRAHDVVVFDVEDRDYSVALNPLQGTAGDSARKSFIASQIVNLIDQMFETDRSSGPVTRDHIRHALLLAMCHPEGGTLADAASVFENAVLRRSLLRHADAHLNSHFSTFLATNGENGYANWLPYLQARLGPFVRDPVLLRTLSRPSTIDLGRLMDEGRIVLIRLSKAVLQEIECQLLGTLLLMQFHTTALARAATPPDRRRPFHLFVDEFHTFANDATPSMFREARKFGLGLTVATQSLSSLRRSRGGDLADAVLANTATKVLFRLSPVDARLLEDYVSPGYSTRDLGRMPNHQALVCTTAGDVPPFMLRTAVAEPPSDPVSPDSLRQASGRRHGTPMPEVARLLALRGQLQPRESRNALQRIIDGA